MKRLFFVFYVVLSCGMLLARDIQRVSTTYEYCSNNSNETPEQAKNIAFQKAKQQALVDKFGEDVTSITNIVTTNQYSGEDATSRNNTFSLGEVSVKGEWIETIKEEVLRIDYIKGFWIVKVYVEGKARKKSSQETDIKFAFVKDVQDVETPTTFRDGSSIFLRFFSPVSGYLCVYLIDEEQNAFCLLPYLHQQTGSQLIEANKEYVFFSEKYENGAQEYTLTCERSQEQNAIYVIFSPNDFTKAADHKGGANFRNEQLPRELTYEAFFNWLNKNRTIDPKMVVRNEIINIRK